MNKTEKIILRVTNEDKVVLKNKAKMSKMGLSQFIRYASLAAKPIEVKVEIEE